MSALIQQNPRPHKVQPIMQPDGSIILVDDHAGKMTLAPQPFETETLSISTFNLDAVLPEDAQHAQLIAAALDAAKRANARLITCRRLESDRPMISALQTAGFHVIECLLTLGRSLQDAPSKMPQRVRLSRKEDAEAVAAIAGAAFRGDRFHVDPLISADSADRLKAAWARNAIQGRADAVFLTESDGRITGFNACLLRGNTAIIDLIAVAPGMQRQGLGRDLVTAALAYYAGKASRMIVGTQSANHRSLVLYEASGFRVEASALTLHLHLN